MTGIVASLCVPGSQAGFTLTATPPSVNGFYRGSSGAAQNITVSATAAVASGASGAVTYAWAQVGMSANTWAIGAAAAAATSFTATAVGNGQQAAATFRCTATDALGRIATATVYAAAFNESTA